MGVWKKVLDYILEFWNDILVLFVQVCDHAQQDCQDWKRCDRNYEWTWSWNMMQHNRETSKKYLFLPFFQIFFHDARNTKKAVFAKQASKFFNRLRRQVLELWMQELFKRYPLLTPDAITADSMSPFFKIELSKEEIARYAEGSEDEHGRRYCLPANCYKQKDVQGNDVSLDKEHNAELWKFRNKFFPEDVNKQKEPDVSSLCLALFRLRKICAFIRKAHEYEVFDEEGKSSGNTAKIEELRASIMPDKPETAYVSVLAANMQRSVNEFIV